ncbi:MAG: PG0541 family transporter-associated protein [Marinilabiliaceae bacterium]|jgi:nitrogen regulatory protein PII|nr:PG0541 family transporter-associated protein [Marinilabiliaceae bacterium]
MKAIFIVYNQAHTEKVEYILNKLGISGYTQWTDMKGRGERGGVPHLGTHTWPEINSATLSVVEDSKVQDVLDAVKVMDDINTDVGARAFVWDVSASV